MQGPYNSYPLAKIASKLQMIILSAIPQLKFANIDNVFFKII